MARSLKLRVVAEGVETLEELSFLRAHQCDEAQWYYFSRPVPADEFAKLLKAGIRVPFAIFAAWVRNLPIASLYHEELSAWIRVFWQSGDRGWMRRTRYLGFWRPY